MKNLPQSWFRHEATASSDSRILRLRAKHGFEGIGIFWTCMESLYINDGHLHADALRTLCGSSAVVDFCIELGLLVEDESGELTNERILEEIEFRLKKSKKASESAKTLWRLKRKKLGYANAKRTQSESNANAMLGEDRRGEEKTVHHQAVSNSVHKPEEPKKNEREKTDEQLGKEFCDLALREQWDVHGDYAPKIWKQRMELSSESRTEFMRKLRVALNSSRNRHTMPLAKKIYYELAGFVNDKGAMEKTLSAAALARRRKLAEDEGGKEYADSEF